MLLTRNFTLTIHKILDFWIPPIIRDSKYFMYVPFKFMFRDKTEIFMNFKKNASLYSEEEYVAVYAETDSYLIQRETSLNEACIKKITRSIIGKKVLEVGCGKAFLAKKIAKKYKVTGVDILIDKNTKKQNKNIKFVNAMAEHLPFKDKSFDTTITTHTLEHVQNFEKAISELRRVTKKRLIIVVPMQKPYKYTFDLHLRFFPFPEMFLLALQGIDNKPMKFEIKNLGGDIYYQEER